MHRRREWAGGSRRVGLAGVLLVIAGGLQAADLEVDASAAAAMSGAQRADLARRVEAIVASVREVLPTLPDDVVVEVRAESQPYSRTGATGAATGPARIAWVFDAARPEGVIAIAERTLESILVHELHHLARGCTQGGAPLQSFLDGAVCEGMATAFARDHADAEQPWASYPPEVAAWYEEVKDLPASATTGGWMFFHDDGRTWIGYKVGTWLVDRAMRASGRSAAELTRVPTGQIVQLAGY